MLVKSYGSTLQGIDAITITIEVNVSPGVQMFIVGLPDNAVRESQQRIFSAFENNKYKFLLNKLSTWGIYNEIHN